MFITVNKLLVLMKAFAPRHGIKLVKSPFCLIPLKQKYFIKIPLKITFYNNQVEEAK